VAAYGKQLVIDGSGELDDAATYEALRVALATASIDLGDPESMPR
jgi:hypothetical protein